MLRVGDTVMSKNHQIKFMFFFFGWQTFTLHPLDFHHSALIFSILFIGDILDVDSLEDNFTQFSIAALNKWEILKETILEQTRIKKC